MHVLIQPLGLVGGSVHHVGGTRVGGGQTHDQFFFTIGQLKSSVFQKVSLKVIFCGKPKSISNVRVFSWVKTSLNVLTQTKNGWIGSRLAKFGWVKTTLNSSAPSVVLFTMDTSTAPCRIGSRLPKFRRRPRLEALDVAASFFFYPYWKLSEPKWPWCRRT
jgi:hypothetical protein